MINTITRKNPCSKCQKPMTMDLDETGYPLECGWWTCENDHSEHSRNDDEEE